MIPLLLFSLLMAPTVTDEVVLFDGKTLDGWTIVLREPKTPGEKLPDPATVFRVENEAIVCSGKPNGYLATKKSYENYTFTVRWKWAEGATTGNSGVLIHVQDDSTKEWPQSIEAQMKMNFAGDFWLNTPPKVSLKAPAERLDPKSQRHILKTVTAKPLENPVGEWNRLSVESRRGTIRVTVNDVLANEGTESSLTSGRIALQSEGTPVQFSQIRLKPLP
ncbi:MAG: 3-keto-disaccharide hydrolase [Gemmataceae bacterium]